MNAATAKRPPRNLPAAGRLITALDFDNADQALELVKRLDGVADFYKVGWQLFLGEGWPVVQSLLQDGKKVFLDLKINDIAQTVRAALGNMPHEFADQLELLTINGNGATAAAAKQGRGERDKPRLLMLTVLSGMDDADMQELYPGAAVDTAAVVSFKTRQALQAGCEGVIASGASVRALREEFPHQDFLIVTPGVRPRGAAQDDHKRALTPGAAIAQGADYLVVGRPITRAADPVAAARAVIAEIEAAL